MTSEGLPRTRAKPESRDSGHDPITTGTDAGSSLDVELADDVELYRSTVQRVFNVLAALGPLAAAIVSAVFGL